MRNELRLQVNIYKAFIYIIIILNLRVFYLVDYNAVPLDDICIIVEVLFFATVFLKKQERMFYRYKWLILFAIVLAVTSSVAAYYNYNSQPFFMGLRAQRHWLMALMMYFPLSKLLKNGALTKVELMSVVDNVGIILGVVTLIQVVVGTGNIFMYVNNNTRYGNIRLYVSATFLAVSFFYHLQRVVSRERICIKDILMLIFPLFIIVFVSQSRMRIIALVASALLLIFGRQLTKRNLIILVVAVIAICVYSGTTAGENMWNMITGSGIVEEDSSIYRDMGHAFYTEENTESVIKFIFGSGYANSEWDAALRITKINENINYNDNGIWGLFYYYGFIFVIWTAVLHFKLVRNGVRGGNSGMAYYLVYGLLGIYSLFPCSFATDISFAVVCAIIDSGGEEQALEEHEVPYIE